MTLPNSSISPFIHDNKFLKKAHKYSDYSLPDYLVKHYWWAYLSPFGVKFFDHGFMVNRILWGQYHAIAQETVKFVERIENKYVAAISCAYGEFFPKLAESEQIENLHLFDVAPIQIATMQKKMQTEKSQKKCQFFLGNAEQIPIQTNSVDTSVLFFLLHELPATVRQNVLEEAIRVTKKNGRIVLADYGEFTQNHIFHQYAFFRNIFEKMEPFLANFWRSDLQAELSEAASRQGRILKLTHQKYFFNKFYRLLEFAIE